MQKFGIVGIPLICVALLAGAILWVRHDRRSAPSGADKPEALILLCNPLLEPPMQAIIEGFQRRFGLPVEARYRTPDRLLDMLIESGEGDVFIPVDLAVMQRALRLQQVQAPTPWLRLHPVIQVARDNPLNIQTLQNLQREETRLALGNAQTTAIGRLARELLHAQGVDATTLQARLTVEAEDLGQLGRAISLRHADAAITWYPLARRHPLTEIIELDEDVARPMPVSIAVATGTSLPDDAHLFVRFLNGQAARDILVRHHFVDLPD